MRKTTKSALSLTIADKRDTGAIRAVSSVSLNNRITPTICSAKGIALARRVIHRTTVRIPHTMLKKATTKTAKNFDGFSLLGRAVVRAPWLVISAWIALVVVLFMAFPALTKVVENQTIQPLPPQAMAATDQMAKDFHESAQNILVVVMTNEHGLNPADNNTYRAVADKLRSDTSEVSAVQDFISTPPLRQLMVSKDNKAFYMAVTLKAPPGSPESSQAYQQITQVVKQATASSDLTTHVTGSAAVIGDLSIVTAHDMHVIEIATAALVL